MENNLKLDYVTGVVSLEAGDGIVVNVLNEGNTDEQTRIVIGRNTGAGVQYDVNIPEILKIPSNVFVHKWNGGQGHSIVESGEYWVKVQISSEFLIPTVTFLHKQNPIVIYKPNDFAVFTSKSPRSKVNK